MPSQFDFLDSYKTLDLSGVETSSEGPNATNQFKLTTPGQSQVPSFPISNIPTGGIQKANVFNLSEDIPDAERGYIAKNAQSGVPLNIHDEVGAWIGLMGSLRRDPSDRMKYLASVFGLENVRADDQGEPLVRVANQKTGKLEDIPFNARGLSVNDLMTVASSIPQMLGAYAGLRGGRSIPSIGAAAGAKGFLRDVVGGAVGAESVGAAEDVATRIIDQQPIRPGEIATTRLSNVPVNMALDYGMAGAGKVLQSGVNAARLGGTISQGKIPVPINLNRFQGPIQKTALEGQQELKRLTGVEYPLGPHETVGLPAIAQGWEYLRNYPSSASAIKQFENLQEIQERLAQEFLYAPSTLQTDEHVGRQITDLLSALKQKRADVLKQSAEASGEAVQTAIKNVGQNISSTRPRQDYGKVGQAVRDKIIAGRDAAKQEQNLMREQIAAMPGGTGKIYASDAVGLQSAAAKQLKALPAPEKIITEQTGLLDQFGKPMTVTKTGEVIEKEFVPDRVVGRLRSLTEEKNYSLHDLIQMRSDVYEDIAAGQSVPNTGTHYLNEIGKMLTQAIDKGITQVGDPALKKALLAANKQYKEKVIPFESSGISHLFPKVTEPGFVENVDAIKRLVGDSEKYLRTVSFLGKNSIEHEQLKRGIFEQVLRDASDDGAGKSINPTALVGILRDMAKDPKTRGVFQDVFGANGQVITDLAETLGRVKNIGAGNISGEDVANLMADPKANMFGFANLVRKAESNAAIYKNKVMKNLVSGKFDPAGINPDEFIDRFLPTGSLSDVRQVWGALSHTPDLQDQISRKILERLFRRSQRIMEPSDILAKSSGELTHLISGRGLAKAMGTAEDIAKLGVVISPEKMQVLKAMLKIKAGQEWAQEAGGGTGLLTKGSAIGGLYRMITQMFTDWKNFHPVKLTKELASLVAYKAFAVMLTSRGLSRITTQTFQPSEMPGLFKSIIVSEPFIKAVIDDAPNDESAYEMLGAAKRMAGMLEQTQP